MSPFETWCHHKGFEVVPFADGSGDVYVYDRPGCRRLKVNTLDCGLTVLCGRVDEWDARTKPLFKVAPTKTAWQCMDCNYFSPDSWTICSKCGTPRP